MVFLQLITLPHIAYQQGVLFRLKLNGEKLEQEKFTDQMGKITEQVMELL
jgi:hypothetical protein